MEKVRHLVPLLLAAAAAACQPGDDNGGHEPAERVRTADGLEYAARTALLASYPVRLRTTATVVNRGDRAATIRFDDGCPVELLVLTRAGEVRWEQSAAEPCAEPALERSLAPGDSAVFETLASAPAILGDSLPDDVYVLVARLRPGGRDVLVRAGRANLVGLPDTIPAQGATGRP
jgi:hypothetical protein